MLLVAYDGGGFHGFAVQGDPGVPTVAGGLLAALSRMSGEEVPPSSLTCAGRTDAGVHARGQVVHVDLPASVVETWLAGGNRRSGSGGGGTRPADRGELPRVAKSLSSQLGPAVAVNRALVAPEGFDARHSALARRYRYEILRSSAADPLARNSSWHVPGPLDLSAMRMAADAFLGEHDFSAFCKRPPGGDGPVVRRVLAAELRAGGEPDEHRLRFEIEANAFCHHMVRSIVATLVGVGQAKLTVADVVGCLRASGERCFGGQMAPPEGLCLTAVRYPAELFDGGTLEPLRQP